MTELDSRKEVAEAPGKVRPGAVLRELRAGQPHALPSLTDDGDAAQPTIEVHRVGDRVSAITARCTCGREIEIQCDYDESAE